MNALAGTGRLVRIALRRDRFVLPLWILGLTAFLTMTTYMSVQGLPTQRDVITETQFMAGNPGMRLLSLSAGASVGAYAMNRTYLTLAILAAVMSTLAVVRHTRQSEERGRDELLRAGVIGPSASLAAAVLLAVAANVALIPLLGAAMMVNGQPAAGSLTAGVAVAGVGIAFSGIAALAAQLSSTARGANGLAMAVLGFAFVVSGVGNMLGTVDGAGVVAYSAWPTWLSPIGWGYEMRPFGEDRWWLLALPLTFATVLVAFAARYAAHRDLGRGILPVQSGRARASRYLLRPIGLAWRLQRSAFLAWLGGMLVFGLIFGSVSGSVGALEGKAREWYQTMGGTSEMTAAWFTSMTEIAGMLVAIYVVQVLLRMREEEVRGRLEAVLAGAVTRTGWVTGYLLTTLGGAAVLLLTFALGMAATATFVVEDTQGLAGSVVAATFAQLPAILVIGAVVLTIFALLPGRATSLSWSVIAVSILLSPVFGLSLGLPDWALKVSPFAYQKSPAAEISVAALIGVLGVALALGVAGLVTFRRRDLRPG